MVLNAVNHFEAAREIQRLNEQHAANDHPVLGKWRKGQEARLLTDSNEMLTLRPPRPHKSPAASELDPDDHRSEERRPHKEAKPRQARKHTKVRPPKMNNPKGKKRPQRFGSGDSGYKVKSPWHTIHQDPQPLKPVPQKTSEKTRALMRRDRNANAALSEEKTFFFGLPEPEIHYPADQILKTDDPSRNVKHEVAYTRNTRPISSSSNSSTEARRRRRFGEFKEQPRKAGAWKHASLNRNTKEQCSSQIAENLQ